MRTTRSLWIAILTICVLPLIPACSDDMSAPETSEVPTMTLAQLAGAPQALALSDREYRLDTYLWRDFMPIAPPEGDPLRATVTLVVVDGLPVPPDTKLLYLWVVNGDSVWATKLTSRVGGSGGFAGDGPMWDPNISVDAIVGVRIDGELRLVRAADQLIHATH